MTQWVKQGWFSAIRQFSIILLLFIYQLLWGLVLYRFIESIVYPLLRRYPGDALETSSLHLFFAESQFQLTKTGISYSYIAILGALLLIRLIASPLIQAGLFHCIHLADVRDKRKFLHGVKRWGLFFIGMYWLQLFLTLLPAYWILPHALVIYDSQPSLTPMLMHFSPWLAGWILYAFVLHLIFLSIGIGKVSGGKLLHSLKVSFRHLMPMALAALLLLSIAGGIYAVTTAVSLVWAGLLALIMHQMYHLVRTLLKVWGVATQYHLWHAKSGL
ncbi:hypothetical protein SY83_06040 [Paenibacillus swuensis]|uniref:Uncharacterized protein n=2 Tax=Paenibacillus swuensis TaxID=1178515 RepID=A0A172TGL0_9BACL|nr:hypothetical protein SY83_06040 [Paenibacillus swuensis]